MAKPTNINDLIGQYVKSVPGVNLREAVRRTIQKSTPGSEPSEAELDRFLRAFQKEKAIKEAKEEAGADLRTKNLVSLNRLARKFLQVTDSSRPIEDRDVDEIVRRYDEGHELDMPLRNASADIQSIIRRFIVPQWSTRKAPQGPVQAPSPSGVPAKTQITRPAANPTPKAKTGAVSPAPLPPAARTSPGPVPGTPQQTKVVPGADWGKKTNPAAPKTFFDRVRQKMQREGLLPLSRKARAWLKDQVTNVTRAPNRKKLVAEGQTVADALIGKMFFFFYDPKYKNELPFWDMFPMVFPIELYEDGFLGLNLHYLDHKNRLILFDKLMELADNPRLDQIQKLNLSYAVLKNVSQFPEVRPTIKRYLASHVRSELLKVDAQDWEIAMFLPVEAFQKSQNQGVWAWSKLKMQNAKLKQKLQQKSQV